jgi:hypothetical protein
MKWLLAVVATLAVTAIVYLRLHSTKTSYVNGLQPYVNLPNREFILEKDCYIFKFKSADTSWPLLGTNLTVPELPADVVPANVGADFPEVRILDVVRTGDRFRIASVRRDETKTKTTITFEVVLVDESTRKFPRVDAFYILDHSPENAGMAPNILPEVAIPLRRE